MTVTVSFEQEEAVLAALQDIHPGPWACHECGGRITAGTGWKPRVALVAHRSGEGAHRSFVDVFCGDCVDENVKMGTP